MKKLKASEIRTDGGTQPRAGIDENAVTEYAAAYESGEKLPPLLVCFDGKSYWLADGFHRYHAHTRLDHAEIECEGRQGTRSDALWMGIEANRKQNSLRFTQQDKAEAIRMILSDPTLRGKSDAEISRQVGVDGTTVADHRKRIIGNPKDAPPAESDTRIVLRNGKPYQMKVANIGRRPAPAPEPAPDAPEEHLEEIESYDAPSPAAPAELRDELGKPVPAPMRANWQKATAALRALMAQVQAVRKGCGEIIDQPWAVFFTHQRAEIDLRNAYHALKFALPYTTCPYCKGSLKHDGAECKACKGQGWVSKDIYESAPKNLRA